MILTAFDENRTSFPGGRILPGRGLGRIAENDREISENWEYFILTNQGKYAIIHADIFALNEIV